MPLDPKAREFLDMIIAAGQPPLHKMSVDEARMAIAAMAGLQGPLAELARVENRDIPGPAGDIPVRVYTPAGGGPFPVLVYFHGGGWVIGDLDSHDAVCRTIAHDVPALVVAVHYRRAPEDKFPAAAEDCYAATHWVAEHATELGGDPARVGIGGDSAGGNLSAVVALMARERGGPRLTFQALVYPATDATMDSPSHRENGEGYFLDAAAMEWFWGHYLPSAAERTNPLVSPLRAADLHGLPPALVITAEFDPLRDEGEAYAARLRAAGVPVAVTRYPGMVHGFFQMNTLFTQAGAAQAEVVAALRAAFNA